MSARCPKCGSFMPSEVCSTCGHHRRDRQRTGLWITLGALGAVTLALATFGIARPLFADDPEATQVTTAAANTAIADPRRATADALRRVGRVFDSPGITDLHALRSAAEAVQATDPDPLIGDYMAMLLTFVADDAKVSFAEVELASEKAGIAAPSQAPAVLAAFDPSVLDDGPFVPEKPRAEVRLDGWVQPASGGVACMLAVQEVTCITQGGQIRVLTGAGAIDKATWTGAPWPESIQQLPPGGALSPDGQIKCVAPSEATLSCTAVVTRDLRRPSTITLPE